MSRPTRRLRSAILPVVVGLLTAGAMAVPGGAQVLERPVAFDSAGRLLVLTPSLAQRLKLTAPAWPVTGAFREARLFASGDTAFVLVALGEVEFRRYPLTVAQRQALAQAIAVASREAGLPAQEVGVTGVEEPARAQFIRGQTALGATWYGLSAGIAADYAGAVYPLALAAAFFTAQGVANATPVTAPMASLATDFGQRGGVLALLLAPDDLRTAAGLVLASSVLGSVVGFNYGRSLTSVEAEAAGWGSTTLAIAATGLSAAAGVDRPVWRAATAAALVAGVPLGLQYPRSAPYVLTTGDLYAMRVPQGVGALLASALIGDGADGRTSALLLTTGYLAGAVAGDRLLAKPYDYTVWQAAQLGTGATSGALLATQILGGDAGSREGRLALALGALAGAVASHVIMGPQAGRQVAALPAGRRAEGARLSFDPAAVLAAVSRAPGRHAILRLTF